MDKQSTEHNEETLVAMLASFRKEACYHDNFEEDFLRNFHLRKETDPATHSAWKLLLERLDNYLQNVSKETIEQPLTEVAPAEKPEFTTGAPSYETSANDNQLKTDSNTDKKPVSRVLIEM